MSKVRLFQIMTNRCSIILLLFACGCAVPEGSIVSVKNKEMGRGRTYSGTAIMSDKGLKPHGRGVGTLPDGTKYDGEWYWGDPNGRGVFTSPDGIRYDGEWKRGKRHGFGRMTYPDGKIEEGMWRDGKFVDKDFNKSINEQEMVIGDQSVGSIVRVKNKTMKNGGTYSGTLIKLRDGLYPHGRGVRTWPDSRRYDGEWKEGKMDGRGVYTWPDGQKYDGDFKDGKRHGFGKMTYPDGKIEEGMWLYGKFVIEDAELNKYIDAQIDKYINEEEMLIRDTSVGSIVSVKNKIMYDGGTYSGTLIMDSEVGLLPHGRGVYTWPDGDKYEGEWKGGKPNGRGVDTGPDGQKYDGEWKDGKQNGRGIYTWPDGDKYEGEWKDGMQNGRGIYTWSDGQKYDGEWKDGKQHGFGKMTYPDGKIVEGMWRDDEFVGGGTQSPRR